MNVCTTKFLGDLSVMRQFNILSEMCGSIVVRAHVTCCSIYLGVCRKFVLPLVFFDVVLVIIKYNKLV
jgi:hypothetical protein